MNKVIVDNVRKKVYKKFDIQKTLIYKMSNYSVLTKKRKNYSEE